MFCSVNLEVVSMIDAAKVRRFLQSRKKNNLANGSVLLGTVSILILMEYALRVEGTIKKVTRVLES